MSCPHSPDPRLHCTLRTSLQLASWCRAGLGGIRARAGVGAAEQVGGVAGRCIAGSAESSLLTRTDQQSHVGLGRAREERIRGRRRGPLILWQSIACNLSGSVGGAIPYATHRTTQTQQPTLKLGYRSASVGTACLTSPPSDIGLALVSAQQKGLLFKIPIFCELAHRIQPIESEDRG